MWRVTSLKHPTALHVCARPGERPNEVHTRWGIAEGEREGEGGRLERDGGKQGDRKREKERRREITERVRNAACHELARVIKHCDDGRNNGGSVELCISADAERQDSHRPFRLVHLKTVGLQRRAVHVRVVGFWLA